MDFPEPSEPASVTQFPNFMSLNILYVVSALAKRLDRNAASPEDGAGFDSIGAYKRTRHYLDLERHPHRYIQPGHYTQKTAEIKPSNREARSGPKTPERSAAP